MRAEGDWEEIPGLARPPVPTDVCGGGMGGDTGTTANSLLQGQLTVAGLRCPLSHAHLELLWSSSLLSDMKSIYL